MANHFTYTPLPKDSIRLLTFSTASDSSDSLTCAINTVSLDNPPKFYALSYTWRSPSTTESILCDGLEMNIATNLYEAVHTLFSPPLSLDLPIWIDAMCINQRDDEEKSHQVHRMGDVFRRASKVIVWLGSAREDSDLAMDSIEPLAEAFSAVSEDTELETYSALQEVGLPDRKSDIWAALGNLYRRKWFGRLWTFQEAVLASEVTMVCGQKTINWTPFATLAIKLNQTALFQLCVGFQQMDANEDGCTAVLVIDWARKKLADYGGPMSVVGLLEIADMKLCCDPRDRVYAMLGLLSESLRERIPISYSTEGGDGFVKTFTDAAKACIEEGNAEILQLVGGRDRAPGLPSWCPNLNSAHTLHRFHQAFYGGITKQTSSSRGFQGRISETGKLNGTGFRADTVLEIVGGSFEWKTSPPGEQQIQRAQRFLEWEGRCLELARKTLSVTTEPIPLCHVFTLTTNTRQRMFEGYHAYDRNLLGAYNNILSRIKGETSVDKNVSPLTESLALYEDTWRQIGRYCKGRRYFSTQNGRLGVGPPGIRKGDTICVIYGAKTVCILRPAEENPEEWYFVGDAFVHGLMELDETPQSARGADEVFTII